MRPEQIIDKVCSTMDEMNDNQLQELLESAEDIVNGTREKKHNNEKTKEASLMVKQNVGDLTVGAMEAIMNLDLEDRKALAPYLTKSKEEMSRKLSEMMQAHLEASAKYRNAEIEKLKDDPTVIWAAHVIGTMSTYLTDLAQILDSAKDSLYDVETTYNSTGFYKMLLSSVDGIVEKMLACMACNGDHDSILGMIASRTQNPIPENARAKN